MDTKDVQVVAKGEARQRADDPDQGLGFAFGATGIDKDRKTSRGRHQRRQSLEKGMEDDRHRVQVVAMEAYRAGRSGQIPLDVLKMYDELTRDQHAMARTTTVLLTSMRRMLGLPEL